HVPKIVGEWQRLRICGECGESRREDDERSEGSCRPDEHLESGRIAHYRSCREEIREHEGGEECEHDAVEYKPRSHVSGKPCCDGAEQKRSPLGKEEPDDREWREEHKEELEQRIARKKREADEEQSERRFDDEFRTERAKKCGEDGKSDERPPRKDVRAKRY